MTLAVMENAVFVTGLLYIFLLRPNVSCFSDSFSGFIILHLWLCYLEFRVEKKNERSFDNFVRKSEGLGLWCTFLLPVALILSCGTSDALQCSNLYRTMTLFSWPLILTTILWICHTIIEVPFDKTFAFHPVVIIFNSIVLQFYGGAQSVLINVLLSNIFHLVLWFSANHLLFSCVRTFRVGEVIALAQGCALFAVATFINVKHQLTNFTVGGGILEFSQVSNVGAVVFALLLFYVPSLRRPIPFFSLAAFIGLLFIIPTISLLIQENALFWLYQFFSRTNAQVWLVVHLLVVSALTVWVISLQTGRSNTMSRKSFHFLFVLAYVPLLLIDMDLLYLTTSVLFGIFVIVECMRVQLFPPFGDWFHNYFTLFMSEDSKSQLIVDHMTLLLGCSIPIWLHPSSQVSLAAFSGLLSVGVGDSLASIGGSLYGTVKWPGMSRTYEGTAIAFIGQLVVFLICYVLGVTNYPVWRFIPAVALSSLLEAFTTQVDNLVLPFFLYSLLIF